MSFDRLPATARLKIETLQRDAEDARVLMMARVQELDRLQKADLPNARNRQRSVDPDDAAAVAAVDAALADLQRRCVECEQAIAERAARQRDCEQTLAQIGSYLDTVPRIRVLVPIEAPKVEVDASTVGGQIEAVRRQIVDLQHELDQLRLAPPSAADVRAAVERHVAELSDLGRPRFDKTGQLRIHWDMAPPQAFLGWIAPDVLRDALLAELGDIEGGISDEERSTRSKAAKRELLRLERVEEQLVVFAQQSGVDVMRRPLASCLAILGVETRKKNAAVVVNNGDRAAA